MLSSAVHNSRVCGLCRSCKLRRDWQVIFAVLWYFLMQSCVIDSWRLAIRFGLETCFVPACVMGGSRL